MKTGSTSARFRGSGERSGSKNTPLQPTISGHYALYTEGGIYLDTDIEIRKPFDELLTA